MSTTQKSPVAPGPPDPPDRVSPRLFALVGLDFPTGRSQPRWWRWIIATIVAAGLSLAACVGLATLGVAAFPSTAGYAHFQFSDYSRLTIAGVLAACVAWPLVTLVSSRARRLFLWLALLVIIVSLAPDAWIIHLGEPVDAVGVLMAMHLALAVITYPALVFIAPQRRISDTIASEGGAPSRTGGQAMTKYLVSFPSSAMQVSDEELPAVSDAAHAVMQQAKDAGAYVYSGGLNEDVAPVLVAGDGSTTHDTYPESRLLTGGFAILELPSRDAAVEWAARIAAACRCAQELREFMFDPLS